MYTIIEEIQNGNFVRFDSLLKMFQPLIIHWLKQIHQFYSEQHEDYYSMAKIILLECAKNFDTGKHVPFESYYKISLYHWYSNYYRKKEINTVSLDDAKECIQQFSLEQEVENKLYKEQLLRITKSFKEEDRQIILLTAEGFTPKEIADRLKRNSKAIRNKKTRLIKKIKRMIETE